MKSIDCPVAVNDPEPMLNFIARDKVTDCPVSANEPLANETNSPLSKPTA